jgi:hypothetical protein
MNKEWERIKTELPFLADFDGEPDATREARLMRFNSFIRGLSSHELLMRASGRDFNEKLNKVALWFKFEGYPYTIFIDPDLVNIPAPNHD